MSQQTSKSISIDKINYRIEFEPDKKDIEYDSFLISYDYLDDEGNKQEMDTTLSRDFKHDFRYLEVIKKHFKWKKGEELCLLVKHNCDGWFRIWKCYGREEEAPYYELIIEKDGWVMKRYWQHYGSPESRPTYFYLRIDCHYNDNICKTYYDNLAIKDKTSDKKEIVHPPPCRYKIEIEVIGFGWCQYINEEERDKKVVRCKNDLWKMKGDVAYDLEGELCETDSEYAYDHDEYKRDFNSDSDSDSDDD